MIDAHVAGRLLADQIEIPEELPNFITFLVHRVGGESAAGRFLETWQDQIFMGLVIATLITVFALGTRNHRAKVPGRLQCFLEMIAEYLNNLIVGVIGPQGRDYTPFLGTIFLYILTMNLFGLIP